MVKYARMRLPKIQSAVLQKAEMSVEFGKRISCNNSVFITVILPKINLILIKMDPKEILSKEILGKVGDKIGEQAISEKVNQFARYGNLFLLFEVMSLRKEIERLKEEIQNQRNRERRKSIHALPVP